MVTMECNGARYRYKYNFQCGNPRSIKSSKPTGRYPGRNKTNFHQNHRLSNMKSEDSGLTSSQHWSIMFISRFLVGVAVEKHVTHDVTALATNSITLWEAHKNINYTLRSGFKRERQTVHYFCVIWYTCSYINAMHASNTFWVPVHRGVHTRLWNHVIYNHIMWILNTWTMIMPKWICIFVRIVRTKWWLPSSSE